jgi:hypothetical protein
MRCQCDANALLSLALPAKVARTRLEKCFWQIKKVFNPLAAKKHSESWLVKKTNKNTGLPVRGKPRRFRLVLPFPCAIAPV